MSFHACLQVQPLTKCGYSPSDAQKVSETGQFNWLELFCKSFLNPFLNMAEYLLVGCAKKGF